MRWEHSVQSAAVSHAALAHPPRQSMGLTHPPPPREESKTFRMHQDT